MQFCNLLIRTNTGYLGHLNKVQTKCRTKITKHRTCPAYTVCLASPTLGLCPELYGLYVHIGHLWLLFWCINDVLLLLQSILGIFFRN